MSEASDNETPWDRQYLQTINRVPVLGEEEEAELVRRWNDGRDPDAWERLIQSHLRLVPAIARRTADEFGFRPHAGSLQEAWEGYANVCRELVLAGNEGLLHAPARFDPSRGARFAACARWSIWKACREEAKWLRSPVKYPKGKQTPWSDSLDSPVEEADGTTFVPLERLTEPENDKLPSLGPMAKASVDLLADPRERHILRARCLTDSPAKLRTLAQEFEISLARAHQLEHRAVRSLGALLPESNLEELAEFYLNNQVPSAVKVGNTLYHPIDDRLDALKELFPWATQSDRIAAHRIADHRQAEASNFNLNRVHAALDDGLTVTEIAEYLGLPLGAVDHLRQLVDWRDGHEIQYTLTEAGLEMIREDDEFSDAA